MPTFLFLGAVAERLDCPPHVIAYLFRMRRRDVVRCPVVGNRRLIPEDYLDEIARELRRLKRKKRKTKP